MSSFPSYTLIARLCSLRQKFSWLFLCANGLRGTVKRDVRVGRAITLDVGSASALAARRANEVKKVSSSRDVVCERKCSVATCTPTLGVSGVCLASADAPIGRSFLASRGSGVVRSEERGALHGQRGAGSSRHARVGSFRGLEGSGGGHGSDSGLETTPGRRETGHGTRQRKAHGRGEERNGLPPTMSSHAAVAVLVIGMAGSGKTTFMQRANAYLHGRQQAPYILNLDPAVTHMPYTANIDIRDTVDYQEVMKQYNLGPNGGIVTALNLFTTKFDQVLAHVEKRATTVEYVPRAASTALK